MTRAARVRWSAAWPELMRPWWWAWMRAGLTRRVRRANGMTGQQLAGGSIWTRNRVTGRPGSRAWERVTAGARVARSARLGGRARSRTRAAASSPHPVSRTAPMMSPQRKSGPAMGGGVTERTATVMTVLTNRGVA